MHRNKASEYSVITLAQHIYGILIISAIDYNTQPKDKTEENLLTAATVALSLLLAFDTLNKAYSDNLPSRWISRELLTFAFFFLSAVTYLSVFAIEEIAKQYDLIDAYMLDAVFIASAAKVAMEMLRFCRVQSDRAQAINLRNSVQEDQGGDDENQAIPYFVKRYYATEAIFSTVNMFSMLPYFLFTFGVYEEAKDKAWLSSVTLILLATSFMLDELYKSGIFNTVYKKSPLNQPLLGENNSAGGARTQSTWCCYYTAQSKAVLDTVVDNSNNNIHEV